MRSGRPVSQWSRRSTAAATGVAGLIAAGAATALVVTGASAPHPNNVVVSDAALTTGSGLSAIFKLHPDLGRPMSTLIRQQKLPAPTYAGDNSRIGVPKNVRIPANPRPDTAVARYVPGPYSGALTPLQLASLALRAGCSPNEAPIAAAVASAESGGNPGAQGDISLMDSTWDWSEGLWQIRGLRDERGTGQLRDSLANANPVTNAGAMYIISSGCSNWTPWTTYNTGAYLAYLPLMKSAVESAVGYKVKTGAYPQVNVSGRPASVPAAGAAEHRHHGASHHKSRSGKKARRHNHRGGPKAPSSSAQPTKSVPKPTSAKPSPATSSATHKKKHHLPLPTKLPTSNLPKPSLPTTALPTLPTSGIPTLPSLP